MPGMKVVPSRARVILAEISILATSLREKQGVRFCLMSARDESETT